MMIPTIDHFIGQQEAVKRFKVALDSSWNDTVRLPHMLFVGPPGCGKTMLASIAAKEMAVEMHERLAQVLNTPGALNGLLIQAEEKQIIFLDELHELHPVNQTVLYRAMENSQVTVCGYGERTFNLELNNFTLIGATTDEHRLLPPLRDRFKVILPFQHYDDDALAKIIIQRSRLQGLEIDVAIAPEIAQRSRGTPRLAIRLLESCHRFARSRGDNQITMEHFQATVELDGIDPLGLGPDEQRFIKYLTERRGEAVRLFTIEATLGIHRQTLSQVIEPFLLRRGLIDRKNEGRVITDRGIEHVEQLEALAAATGEQS